MATRKRGKLIVPAVDRFGTKYTVDAATGCWLWTAATKPNGYGILGKCDGTRDNQYAHRFAYEHFIGPIPPGLQVCHRCDVRNCVNPEHLFLGTQADNQADMVAKGRSLRGERHNLARVTEPVVLEIRRLWDDEGALQRELADRFGITKQQVSNIVRGHAWKHLLPDGWVAPAAGKWSRP